MTTPLTVSLASIGTQHIATARAVDRSIVSAIDEITRQEIDFWSAPMDYNPRLYGHRFFQYPAMMVPIIQERLISVLKQVQPQMQNLLDPFMGSATTFTAGMRSGLNCYGQDVNPLAILLAKVKTGAFDYSRYREAAAELVMRVAADHSSAIAVDFPGLNKWFTLSVAQELSKLVRAIRVEPDLATRQVFWVTLAETIRLTSNDRTSTYKLHARPLEEIVKRQVSPHLIFSQLIQQNLADMEGQVRELNRLGRLTDHEYRGHIRMQAADSSKGIRISNTTTGDSQFDVVVSSPPYGDNKTTVPYGQHAYLPLQWIDFADIDPDVSTDCLRTTHEIDTNSLGGRLSAVKSLDRFDLELLSPALESDLAKLTSSKPKETKKVVCFMRDLNQVLTHCMQVLSPNGYMVWTIGNRRVGGLEIRNSLILRELLEYHGAILVHQVERAILNKRMPNRNQIAPTMSREDILIFRKR